MKAARGVVPPLVTPLTDQCDLDVAALERLVEHVLAGGVHGLLLLGTTGEGPSLRPSVQREMIRQTCRIARGRVPLFVGITDTVLDESLTLGQFAAEEGCDYVVAAPPYYFPLGQDDLLAYYKQLLFETPLPALLYNMPATTGMSIAPQTVEQLLEQERMVGVKDSSGDLAYFGSLLQVCRQRPELSVMVGPEHLLGKTLAMGGDGGVAGGANLCPALFVNLYESLTADAKFDPTTLQQTIELLGQIYRAGELTVPGIIARLKTALSLRGICSAMTAPPIVPVEPAVRAEIEAILVQLDAAHEVSSAG